MANPSLRATPTCIFVLLALLLGACASPAPETAGKKRAAESGAAIPQRNYRPRGQQSAPKAHGETPSTATAGAGTGASSAGPALTPEQAKDYRIAYDEYLKGEYDNALESLKAFQFKYPRDAHHPQVENLLGLSYLLTHRASDAIEHFRSALAQSAGNPVFGQYLLYNLAKGYYDAGQFVECEQALAQIHPEGLDRDNQLKYHYLKASVFQKKSLPYEASRELLAASLVLPTPVPTETRANLATSLDQSLQKVEGVSQLSDLAREFDASPIADVLYFRLAAREFGKGDTAQGEGHAQLLLKRFPDSPYASQANALLQSSEGKFPLEPTAIGVLLPLKGKAARFGQRSLQGIELALRIFEHKSPDSHLTLVIEDSGDEPEQAAQALQRLVARHHVAAVIGPFLSKGIDQLSKQAQDLRVPLLPLSTHTGVPGEFVLPAGVTNQQQAYEIARYAIQKQGLRRFAILAPRDRFFEEFYQHFWDAVESLGGKVMGFENYAPDETDFKQPVDKLAGLYYTEARFRELSELAKLRETNHIRKRTRKTEQYYNLPPIVDFDAVFIPDLPKTAGLIPNFFHARDVDQIEYLGLSAWDSPEFPSRAGSLSDRALFVDAFFPESTQPEVRKFIDAYRAEFGQEPTSTEAVAYDAARLLEQALHVASGSDGSLRSRSDLAKALREIQGFPGVTGKISFRDGQFARELQVLTFRGGRVVEAGPSMPPPSAPGGGKTAAAASRSGR